MNPLTRLSFLLLLFLLSSVWPLQAGANGPANDRSLSLNERSLPANEQSLSAHDPADRILLESVDPLEKLLKETAHFNSVPAEAHVARGEHATLQFAIRSDRPITNLRVGISTLSSGQHQLTDGEIGFVGYVRQSRSTANPARNRLQPVSGFYPDPIYRSSPARIDAHTTQPIWITIPVPADAPADTYSGNLVVMGELDGEPFQKQRDIQIEVYPVTIDDTRLWVTNWFSLSDNRLSLMNNGESVEPYSDHYWELMRAFARKKAAYRQNVALISPLQHASFNFEGDEVSSIDFSNFDRMVRIFEEEGVLGRIEGGHIGTRMGDWSSNFGVRVPNPETGDNAVNFDLIPFEEERAREFYSRFFSALVEHLEERGWLDRYMQHIADEPTNTNYESYLIIAEFLKDRAPELPIIEATHTQELQGLIDVWVPQLDHMHDGFDFYRERMEAGDEVWYYTCLFPQGEYANRFVEQPLILTRILHWINYRAGVTGYLHWGFNFWNDDPYEDITVIQTESGNVLPGGDAWIVYPVEGGFLSSIRLEAMRDGIVDYELLRMAEERFPEEDVREFARQVAYDFNRYDTSIPAFRDKRKQLLERLSED